MILTIGLIWIGGFNVLAAITSVGPPAWLSLGIGIACTIMGVLRYKYA